MCHQSIIVDGQSNASDIGNLFVTKYPDLSYISCNAHVFFDFMFQGRILI
jgi:hypothetical protein